MYLDFYRMSQFSTALMEMSMHSKLSMMSEAEIEHNRALRADNDSTNPKDLIGVKKPRISLVPPTGIIHEAKAFENGAVKYGAYNYRDKKVQALIYVDAAIRHIYQWLDGEENAEDSGVHHLGHARACLNILLDAQVNGFLLDNRPTKGKSSELIKQLTEENK